MSHFKTLFIFTILLITKASFALSCLQHFNKAQDSCGVETYYSLKTIEQGEDYEAMAAFMYIAKTYDHCREAVDACKKFCKLESKGNSDFNDVRSFELLLNCESGHTHRNFNEKMSHKLFATKAAHDRNLTRPMSGTNHGRTTEATTGFTNWPMGAR